MAYTPPLFLFNAHLETIYPSLFRKVDFHYPQSEFIATADNDVLEVSLSSNHADKLVIISHGLEGDMNRAYIKGMAKACYDAGFDVLTWNYRGCGLTMNKQLRFYHSGATDDLDAVIQFAISKKRYTSINLVGFSLGGNITLKYLGEKRERSNLLSRAVAISVPMDLKASCKKLTTPSNSIYARRFLKSLKNKVVSKSGVMQGIDVNGIESIRTLQEFDNRYTAPLHGYKDADDYYNQCSSIRFVDAITIPTLIVNALNDPFLSPECYPVALLSKHPFVTLETPARGGHVGFAQFNRIGLYWSEERAIQFLLSVKRNHHQSF